MQSKKKIVLFGNTSWSMYNFRKDLIVYLQSLGYKVAVIAPIDEYSSKIASLGCEYFNIKLDRKGINPLRDIVLLIDIYKLLKSIKPDICFFYTIKPIIYGCFVCSHLKINNVAVTTGLGHLFSKQSIISMLVKFMYKFSLRKCNKVFFLNNDDCKCFIDNHIVTDKQALVLKGEGINPQKFLYDKCKNTPFVFLLISRMLWSKGIGVFVEAARKVKQQYPSVQFNLLGFVGVDNPEAISLSQIKTWTEEGFISYLGETDNVIPFINESTSIVLPSFYGEGIPFTLLEGASMARPLITTNNVGCRDVVVDTINGYVCEKQSVSSLVEAMIRMIELPVEDLQRMGEQGRLIINKEFHQDVVFQKYKEVIEVICVDM